MEFAGERLGKVLWDPAALPGQMMNEEFNNLTGVAMSQGLRELMRLRSDKVVAGGLSSRSWRTLVDGARAMDEGVLAGLDWDQPQ